MTHRSIRWSTLPSTRTRTRTCCAVVLFQKPKPASDGDSVIAPKPPTDPNRPLSRKGSRHRLQHSSSQDAVSGDVDTVKTRSGSLQDGTLCSASPRVLFLIGWRPEKHLLCFLFTAFLHVAVRSPSREGEGQTGSVPTTPDGGRRTHSGPKERTRPALEERGVGDGSEAVPRVESRQYVFLLHTNIT